MENHNLEEIQVLGGGVDSNLNHPNPSKLKREVKKC